MKLALPTLSFPSLDAIAAWRADNHASSPGVWLKLAKKAPTCGR